MIRKWLVAIAMTACATAWAQPLLPPGTLVNAADYTFDMSPGALVSLFGQSLAPYFEGAQQVPLPTTIAGTSVEATDGTRTVLLPLVMVSEGQINAQLPFDMGPELTVRVITAESTTPEMTFTLEPRAPRIFTWNQGGSGTAIVTHHSDNEVARPDHPVRPGEWITIWATGLGEVFPPLPAGVGANDGSEGHPLNEVTGNVVVLLDGRPAEVSFAGLTPYQTGLYQVNAYTPNFDRTGDIEIRVIVDGVESQPGLTVPAVQNGFYWAIGAGLFPNGQTRNAAPGAGSAVAFLQADREQWGEEGFGEWTTANGLAGGAAESSGIALTMKLGDTIVYDNNGIETGQQGEFYSNTQSGSPDEEVAGLIGWFSQSSIYRAIHASYFRLNAPTTVDQIIAYFDGDGEAGLPFDPENSWNTFRVNIWSNGPDDLPASRSFTGDIFSSDSVPGVFKQSPTGVARVYNDGTRDRIHRLVYRLNVPVTFPAGEYWFASDVAAPGVDRVNQGDSSRAVRMMPTPTTASH